MSEEKAREREGLEASDGSSERLERGQEEEKIKTCTRRPVQHRIWIELGESGLLYPLCWYVR